VQYRLDPRLFSIGYRSAWGKNEDPTDAGEPLVAE